MTSEAGGESTSRAGPILFGWIALSLLLQAALWVSGVQPTLLGEAVEVGAARVEMKGIGEQTDDVIRKAIRIQHDSLPFWKTLGLFADFVVMPLGLVVRAALVATIFSALAAITGRTIDFARAYHACALAQGFWVLGLAVRVALSIALKTTDVETSPTLLLPPGQHPAAVWVAMRQLDVFPLIGWFAMALGGWKRRQVGPISAFLVCGMLWAIEAIVAIQVALIAGAGMRLSLMPEV